MILTKKNAADLYKENLNKLETLETWTEEEKEEFIQYGKEEIKEYGLHYAAVDYNSFIVVIKYLMKKS